jgi:hypothetical protein
MKRRRPGPRLELRSLARALLLPCVVATWGCQEGEVRPDAGAPPVPEGVVPAHGTDPVGPDPAPAGGTAAPEPPALRTLAADTVRGWVGPAGRPFEVALRTPGSEAHLHTRIGQETFALPGRVSNRTLIQYPCTSCHEGVVVMADRIVDAHRNIQPVHPTMTGATCATCHVADSVQRLTVPGGATVSMDHAYRLCAQCHSSETRDWAAGAHGKRLEGWRGRRIVMNCTDCHDPHRPAIQPRIPYPGPRLPRTGGGPP